MVFYNGQVLTKTANKNGGKNQSSVDGFYKNDNGEEFFIKKPADKRELFTELFAGLLLREFMAQGLVDKAYFPSLICADLIQFEDGSYGLIQPKVVFVELYKIIGTGYRDGSDRDPLTEMLAGPSYYTELLQQGQYFGLSTSLMFSLLLGDYSVHSGNVVILNNEQNAPKQFGRIDWGAAFRYFAHEDNNKDILTPYEYRGMLNFKWFTKGYINNYQYIKGLFPSIAEKSGNLKNKIVDSLPKIVSNALAKIPADLLDSQTQQDLANYLSIPAFAKTTFGPQGDYQPIVEIFSSVLASRLTKLSELKEPIYAQANSIYQSVLNLPPFVLDTSLPIPDQFASLLKAITEDQKLDFSSLDLTALISEFNRYVIILSKQTDAYNLWETKADADSNRFTYSKNEEIQQQISLFPLLKKYRESSLLHLAYVLEVETDDTLDNSYTSIIENFKAEHEQQPWTKTQAIFTIGHKIIGLLSQLKSKSNDKDTLVVLKSDLNSFMTAKTILNEELVNRPIQNVQDNVESYSFYSFNDEELMNLTGFQLYLICLEEMRGENSSLLLAKIINNKELWRKVGPEIEKNTQIQDLLSWRIYLINFKASLSIYPDSINKEEVFTTISENYEKLPKFLQDEEIQLNFDKVKSAHSLFKEDQKLFADCLADFNKTKNLTKKTKVFDRLKEIIAKPTLHLDSQCQSNFSKAQEEISQDYFVEINSVSQATLKFVSAKNLANKEQTFKELETCYLALPKFLQDEELIKRGFIASKEEIISLRTKVNHFNELTLNHNFSILNHQYPNSVNFNALKRPICFDIFEGFQQIKKAFNELPPLLKNHYHAYFTHFENINTYLILKKSGSNFKEIEAAFNKLIPGTQKVFWRDFQILKAMSNQITEPNAIDYYLSLQKLATNDLILACALQNNSKKLSKELIADLLILQKFYSEKTQEGSDKGYGKGYSISLDNFYTKALEIRLSNQPIKEQSKSILTAANKEFKHRDEGLRLVADVLMVISVLFGGLGLLIMLGRSCTTGTVFFSNAKTKREEDLTTKWLKDEERIEENATNLFMAPLIQV